jgi:periplasmic protein TonB
MSFVHPASQPSWPDLSLIRPGIGAAGSFVTHAVLAALLTYFGHDECEAQRRACIDAGTDPAACQAEFNLCHNDEVQYDLVEFELPPPEPEKPPEPEPIVKATPPTKVAKAKPDKVRPAPKSDTPKSDEPPPPFRVDRSQTVDNGNSGVNVNTGEPGGTPGGTGDTKSKGTGSNPRDAKEGAGAAAWEPRGELYIRELPQVLNVPQEQCPAVQELGIEGVVILTVQVRRDGSIKDVKVARDIGHGCGKVAARALRKSRFKPAIATNGQPADFELRYEYEFQLNE